MKFLEGCPGPRGFTSSILNLIPQQQIHFISLQDYFMSLGNRSHLQSWSTISGSDAGGDPDGW